MDAKPYREALGAVLEHARPLPKEHVTLPAADGRVLAETVRAARDEPPAPKSAMDGFALRSVDTADAGTGHPVTLGYEEIVGAGHLARTQVGPGKAVRIMTGALLPRGADAVVKQEDTEADGPGRILLSAPLAVGENVIARGATLSEGAVLVESGSRIGPHALGLLAGQGLATIPVYRQARVGLLALGDELLEPGTPSRPGGVYVSNLYVLEALARRDGAVPVRLGIAEDDPTEIEARLRTALSDERKPCDVVVTLGGSHQGDFDFGERVLRALGAHLHFRHTLINMGGSTLFATRGGTLFFGLPGTPAASWLAFEVLVRPALLRLQGREDGSRPMLAARLTHGVWPRPGRVNFIPARVQFSVDGEAEATPLGRSVPMELPPGLLANGLIHLTQPRGAVEAGAIVLVEWLDTP